jgi:hypothetical protein
VKFLVGLGLALLGLAVVWAVLALAATAGLFQALQNWEED